MRAFKLPSELVLAVAIIVGELSGFDSSMMSPNRFGMMSRLLVVDDSITLNVWAELEVVYVCSDLFDRGFMTPLCFFATVVRVDRAH